MHPALRYSYKVIDRIAPLHALAERLHARSKQKGSGGVLSIACDIEALVRPLEANQPKQLGDISLVQLLCEPAIGTATTAAESTESGDQSAQQQQVEEVHIIDVLSLGKERVKAAIAPIMEDPAFRKIMFDCRRDVEALSSQLQIRPRCVLDLQLMHAGQQWKLRASERRSGLQYVLKQEVGVDRQAGDVAVSKAMMLGNRPVWDVRPLPEHFLEYAADDVRHLYALYDTMRLRHSALVDASERISEEYVNFYAQGRAVEEEADPKSHNVRSEWLERYFGPAGVCGFCGARGHAQEQCFRRGASSGSSSAAVHNNSASAAATSAASNGGASSGGASASSAKILRCSYCGGLGHLSTHCYKKNPQILRCAHCQQMGHREANCFKKNPCSTCGGAHKPEKCLKRSMMPTDQQQQQQQES